MQSGNHILILDDDEAFRKTLVLEFSDRGYVVFQLAEAAVLPVTIRDCAPFDFAIVDLRLKKELGTEWIEQILIHSPQCRLVILTGYPTIATCVRALKKGAVNYLTKPASIELIEQALWLDEVDKNFNFDDSDNQSQSLSLHEREYIEFVLFQCDNNVTKAAERLGIHRQSLQRKLRKYPPTK